MKNVISEEYIYLDTEIKTQDELFDFLACKMVEHGRASNIEEMKEGFYKREAEFSTAMNDGIAIPHCRVGAIVDATVIIVRNVKCIMWSDEESVDVFFALLIPEANENQIHIKILAQVAQLIMEDSYIEIVRTSRERREIYKEMQSLNELSLKEEL